MTKTDAAEICTKLTKPESRGRHRDCAEDLPGKPRRPPAEPVVADGAGAAAPVVEDGAVVPGTKQPAKSQKVKIRCEVEGPSRLYRNFIWQQRVLCLEVHRQNLIQTRYLFYHKRGY